MKKFLLSFSLFISTIGFSQNGKIMLGKLDDLKIKYTYYEYPGGHTWPVWRNDLYNFAPLLFQ